MTETEFLKTREAAKLLRVAPRQILRLIALGRLRATDVGLGMQPRFRIDPRDIQCLAGRPDKGPTTDEEDRT
jgi:excisionase family DNA binding protein